MKLVWPEVKDSLTLLIASTGAILGVINTVSDYRRKKVRLSVKATHAYFVSHSVDFGSRMTSIEVMNLSEFPVYVSEIGFEIIGSSHRVSVTDPLASDRKPFYRKLDSRQSITGYFDPPTSRMGVMGRCFAKIESGEKFYGNMLNG